MDEIDDRRGSGRVYIMNTVVLGIGGQSMEATAMDLSLTGVAVWAPQGVSADGTVNVRMQIDDQGPIELDGRVARQYESDGGAVWGIEFTTVAQAVSARLQAYLESVPS